MAYWKRTSVKSKNLKTKTRGITTKRVIGRKNYTDAGFKAARGKVPTWRKKNFRNTTDGARRTGGLVRPMRL